MKCPACDNSLTALKAGDIEVEVCRGGCGGVWFDDREVKKFDEEAEVDGAIILDVSKAQTPKLKEDPVRYCPKCPEEELCRRFYDIQNQVEVDQCLKCSGIWLDTGELKTIRNQYATEADRVAAADAYLEVNLKEAEEAIGEGYNTRLNQWQEDTTFTGTLRSLFSGFLK